ncbi:MAG: nicotinate phosphoribosyltransferase, partial [Acutalibacteraceae bacterium]|nr:nicotinate phosphoribosyltransferase [Acutalibacteraceae bacterium]
KIKLSENVAKVTTPGAKNLWRLYDNETGKALADLITLADEVIDDTQPYELFDPDVTWKRKTVENYTARPLLQPLFIGGKCVYDYPDIETIRTYCAEQVDTLWDEVKRFENPHNYYVDMSQSLWDMKNEMINKYKPR